jgi:hypothetical protein
MDVIGVHPMPAATSVVVGLSSSQPLLDVGVTGIDGRRMDVPWRFEGQTLIVDVRALAPGTYTMRATQGAKVLAVPIVIFR